MTQKPYQILVSGRVQGVGFRYFTAQTAISLSLQGWVRNLVDGRVEALVNCGQDQLQSFLSRLREGPSQGKVEELVCNEVRGTFSWQDFYVELDGEKPWSPTD